MRAGGNLAVVVDEERRDVRRCSAPDPAYNRTIALPAAGSVQRRGPGTGLRSAEEATARRSTVTTWPPASASRKVQGAGTSAQAVVGRLNGGFSLLGTGQAVV